MFTSFSWAFLKPVSGTLFYVQKWKALAM